MLGTIPILGTVPNMVPKKKKEKVDIRLKADSPFALKESYSDIRTNLLFTARGEKCPVYAITSADMDEGKSINCLNVATAFAQLGRKTLLIDADMRKSELKNTLGIEWEKEGLSDYLAGITEDYNMINSEDNLDIILAGSVPPNPAELLMSKRWEAFLAKAKEEYEMIIIDLPPVGVVSDALALATTATAYVIVVREQVTKFDRTEMAVRKLEPLGANISGFIYNGMSIKSPDYNYKKYGYGNGYGY